MNFKKVAKPGKIMKQPPKDPNSGKMDSQIFIGKEDPQHSSKKKKEKKEDTKTASSDNGVAIVKYEEGGEKKVALISCSLRLDTKETIKQHLMSFQRDIKIIDVEIVPDEDRPTEEELEKIRQADSEQSVIKEASEETIIVKAKLDNEWENIDKYGLGDKQLVDLFVDFAESTGGTYEGLYKGSPKDYVPQINMLNRAILLAVGSETEPSPEDIKKSAELIGIALKGIDQVEESFLTASKKKDKKSKKKKEWDPNPWAVCTESVGSKAGTTERSEWDKETKEKYERCVMDVKKEQKSFNLSGYLKNG